MHNPSDCIAIIRDAEYVASTPSLVDSERALILSELILALPEAFNRPWIDSARNALERLYAPYRYADTRSAEGQQNAAQVDSGSGASEAEAPEGPAEGKPEQAKDAGIVAASGNGGGATPAPAPKTQKPKSKTAG
jgi:hypothetical protein